jgi:HEAT repeat protein
VSEQLRIEAINTMERDPGNGRTDDATYLRTLYPKLQAERLKIAAIAAISKAAGADNEQFVLRIARDANESSEVRASAISRMYRLPGVSVAELGKLYDAAESRAMREQIISVLGQRKEPETLDKLFEIAKSGTDPRLKSQAVNALMRKDDPRAKKMLSDIVGN